MDYTPYLPDIDVEDGKARVMNNLKLYFRLVNKFDGAKMVGDIVKAVKAEDDKAVAHSAHALKGISANLGFPIVNRIAAEIEMMSKEGKDCKHMEQPLMEAMAQLSEAIGRFLATQQEL